MLCASEHRDSSKTPPIEPISFEQVNEGEQNEKESKPIENNTELVDRVEDLDTKAADEISTDTEKIPNIEKDLIDNSQPSTSGEQLDEKEELEEKTDADFDSNVVNVSNFLGAKREVLK